MSNNQSYKKAFILLTSLFFMWGLLTVLVDSLIPRLKEIFELTFFQAGFVQFAFFIAYGLVSIPAGSLLHKIGYKKGIILGLAVMGLGCLLFYPAAAFRMFPLFMLGYFILASGMTVLQVAANPYVTVLGDEKTASSRLNLSQAFNSLGTAIAPALGAVLILSDNIKTSAEIKGLDEISKESYFLTEAAAVQKPFVFLAIALLVLAVFVKWVNLPQILNKALNTSYHEVLKHKRLRLGVVGIFLYVGAEVAIGSYLVSYFLDMNLAGIIKNNNTLNHLLSSFHGSHLSLIDDKAVVGTFLVLYWSGAMVGRFLGSYLTTRYAAAKVLGVFAILAMVSIIISISTGGLIAMWFILAVGLFNSIMFPTIFSLAIEGLGELKPHGSGLLCTAIAGGAFIPPLFGLFTDISGFKIAFVLIILCYAYILFFSKKVESI
ncbi:MAG: sugar MFS transporter [Flavobacteriales bacterium]|nr:sugar MFS transporter [Flavobacteriales bacterium]MCB9365270.1 sugar MFS transporter [Flavobacteriales bacterium]